MFVEVMMTEYILTEWKKAPNRSRRSYTRMHDWQRDDDYGRRPLSRVDVKRYKLFLKRVAPSHYKKVFPEEQ
jgi:hypothetical protein